ncbi:MAG: pyridoxamine 5'-phosphate oxidase family protein [Algoriphagus sp.]|jgi:pyridoxamine 5'-phosphate oxidase|nr:pyridoxamine 5'-phosphate oxidase family protein [Algoriphagus sp.]
MLFSATDSHAEIWQTLLHELQRGALDPKHPFRYLILATVGNQFPQVRTLVLRQFSADLEFLVYTDARSSKVKELLEVPRVSLLFYHPKKQVQVRVHAHATIHVEDELARAHWKRVSDKRRSEYQSKLGPGTRIGSPSAGWESSSEHSNFSVVKFVPLSIEVLQLDREGHLRIQFDLASGWKGSWLVP